METDGFEAARRDDGQLRDVEVVRSVYGGKLCEFPMAGKGKEKRREDWTLCHGGMNGRCKDPPVRVMVRFDRNGVKLRVWYQLCVVLRMMLKSKKLFSLLFSSRCRLRAEQERKPHHTTIAPPHFVIADTPQSRGGRACGGYKRKLCHPSFHCHVHFCTTTTQHRTHLSFPKTPLLPFCPLTRIMSLRFAMSSARNSSAASKQRLTQVQRHFSATTSARQEIQDAYILSASRTPTARVRLFWKPSAFQY